MQLADGTLKKGLFENNIFIEEISEVDEDRESSIMDTTQSPQIHSCKMPDHMILNSGRKKKGKKKKGKTDLRLPTIDPSLGGVGDHQSGRHYSSNKKGMKKNSSEPMLGRRYRGIGVGNRKKYNAHSYLKKGNKNSLSLPKISKHQHDSNIMSARLKNFEGAAKNQAAERKKLESYFKSLDKAMQILRNKKQHEMASQPWRPVGPVPSLPYRPASRVHKI